MIADVVCGHCGLGPDQADALGVHVQSVCKGAFAAVERLRASLTAVERVCNEIDAAADDLNDGFASAMAKKVTADVRAAAGSGVTP